MSYARQPGSVYDDLEGVPVANDHVHEELHAGTRQLATDYQAALGAVRYYTVTTGANLVHFVGKIFPNAEVLVQLIEAPTVTVAGSAMAFHNKNRGSSKTTTVAAATGATVTNATGTVLENTLLGSTGAGNRIAPGSNRGDEEWDLAPNTVYAVKLTPSGATDVSVSFDIYE
jgi:hypothetical protein